MSNYENELIKEIQYFNKTIETIKSQLLDKIENNESKKNNLISSRKEMWDNTDHSSNDFDSVIEMSQYMQELNMRTSLYINNANEIQNLIKMQNSPYFARVDFTENNSEKEKIYIGRYSLIDEETENLIVYDWRCPIASVFYRYELGDVQYQAPKGNICGNVSLKRQYEIKKGNFEYFFDTNLEIVDDCLRNLLSKNTSTKMKSIVETIQKDQDVIIRDSENELLIVQGVAGSGKTSVALHRVAYLMYKGLTSKLSSNNILILSPNKLFSKYISNVLPELGEDNVKTLSFEDICNEVFCNHFKVTHTRNQFIESLINCSDNKQKELLKSSMEFKSSNTFVIMLKRFVTYYEQKLIPFNDIYYNNRVIFNRTILKSQLLKRDTRIPVLIRLKQIEVIILDRIREENKNRIIKLEQFIKGYPEHIYDAKAFARMLSIRENKNLISCIHKFTKIDFISLYAKMFHDKTIFYNLAKGLELPENIEEIRQHTDKMLSNKDFKYEDFLSIAFMQTKMVGCDVYNNIKQVVIDEAQDYYPIHFEILNMLFPTAKYTVLGDINQTIEKQTSLCFYNDIQKIFNKKTSTLYCLSKSFRCTNEIINFSKKFIDNSVKQECFSRNGITPKIIYASNKEMLDQQLKSFIKDIINNYKSICVLCKSIKESYELYERIKDSIDVTLIDDCFSVELSGVFITSIYMSKGLEFDVVLIYDVDNLHYHSLDDKKLLYIASTRALHRLALFYTGEQCKFLNEKEN